jgi:hypothetical protein
MNVFKKAKTRPGHAGGARPLTPAEIQTVSGGINPQPLPPNHPPEPVAHR